MLKTEIHYITCIRSYVQFVEIRNTLQVGWDGEKLRRVDRCVSIFCAGRFSHFEAESSVRNLGANPKQHPPSAGNCGALLRFVYFASTGLCISQKHGIVFVCHRV